MDAETLFNLLPAIYRVRDAEQDGPLQALMGVLAEQVERAGREPGAAL